MRMIFPITKFSPQVYNHIPPLERVFMHVKRLSSYFFIQRIDTYKQNNNIADVHPPSGRESEEESLDEELLPRGVTNRFPSGKRISSGAVTSK